MGKEQTACGKLKVAPHPIVLRQPLGDVLGASFRPARVAAVFEQEMVVQGPDLQGDHQVTQEIQVYLAHFQWPQSHNSENTTHTEASSKTNFTSPPSCCGGTSPPGFSLSIHDTRGLS